MSSSTEESSAPKSSNANRARPARLFLPHEHNRIVYEHEDQCFRAYAKDITGQVVCFGHCPVGIEVNPMTFDSDPHVSDWISKCWRYLSENTYRKIPLKPLVNMKN